MLLTCVWIFKLKKNVLLATYLHKYEDLMMCFLMLNKEALEIKDNDKVSGRYVSFSTSNQ